MTHRHPLSISHLAIRATFTFLNLVTQKINLFPSSYASSCPVHSYNFQVGRIGGFCPQERNNKHPDLPSAAQATLSRGTPSLVHMNQEKVYIDAFTCIVLTRTQMKQKCFLKSPGHFLGMGHSLPTKQMRQIGAIFASLTNTVRDSHRQKELF